ncbi:MAG: D-aminoacyl-tRNA deacylase [Treponema sp.]|jgi:D-tyrosyl-tRNA(Tyr) deacylase|nr:D-aminoacyl-tRNA deacylase [Treponema sp.]
MKALVQRVFEASVSVEGKTTGRISSGLLVYLGVARDDAEADADWLAGKISNLRIFDDAGGKMNLSLKDGIGAAPAPLAGGAGEDRGTEEVRAPAGVLAVSQFTLLGDARKGRRPSWEKAAEPEKAKKLYEYFIERIRGQGLVCECGVFQAYMRVTYTNEGPVTLLLDSKER